MGVMDEINKALYEEPKEYIDHQDDYVINRISDSISKYLFSNIIKFAEYKCVYGFIIMDEGKKIEKCNFSESLQYSRRNALEQASFVCCLTGRPYPQCPPHVMDSRCGYFYNTWGNYPKSGLYRYKEYGRGYFKNNYKAAATSSISYGTVYNGVGYPIIYSKESEIYLSPFYCNFDHNDDGSTFCSPRLFKVNFSLKTASKIKSILEENFKNEGFSDFKVEINNASEKMGSGFFIPVYKKRLFKETIAGAEFKPIEYNGSKIIYFSAKW